MGDSDFGSTNQWLKICDDGGSVFDCNLSIILTVGSFAFGCIPSIIIASDVWSAFRKRKHWIPADSLVLGALALQLLALLHNSFDFSDSDPVDYVGYASYKSPKACRDLIFFKTYWVSVVGGRVSVCVLMGCLLSGVARPLSSNLWADMAALCISSSVSLFQISYETHRLDTAFHSSENPLACGIGMREFVLMQLVNVTILVLIVFLVLLLSSAALASVSFRQIISPKIPTIFAPRNFHTHFAWEMVEEQVTKSWIVIRTSDPQYILARSCLTSSIALLITICNGILVRQVVHFRPSMIEFHYIKFMVRCGVVAIGSIVIYCRWITAVVYYPTGLEWKWSNLTQYFQIEDFWKSHLLGLIHNSNGHGHVGGSCLKKLFIKLCRIMRLHKLLHVLLWLQMFSVMFSKVCCLLSQLFLCNKYLGKLLIGSAYQEFSYLYTRKSRRECRLGEGSDYDKYFKALVTMQGENSAGLWIANKKSIRQIQMQMKKGEEEGKKCNELVSFLRDKSSPDFCGEKCVKPQNGLFVRLEVERELDVRKYSWKMTAVSIIAVIIELSSFTEDEAEANNVVDRAIEACSQAWNIMEVVENSDGEAVELSKEADKIFENLKKSHKWLDYTLPLSRSDDTDRSPAAAKAAIEKLVEKGNEITSEYQSRKWSEAIAGYNLYRIGGVSMNRLIDNVEESFAGMCSILADVMGSCTVKAAGVIMEECKKLAIANDEESVWKIAGVGGKVKGMMENVGWKLKWSTEAESQLINTALVREEFPVYRKYQTFQLR